MLGHFRGDLFEIKNVTLKQIMIYISVMILDQMTAPKSSISILAEIMNYLSIFMASKIYRIF